MSRPGVDKSSVAANNARPNQAIPSREKVHGKTLFTGATGLIGSHALPLFEDAAVLSRSPQKAEARLQRSSFAWQPLSDLPPKQAFSGVDRVIHLAGEPIAEGRWSADKKHRINDSRRLSTRHLVARLRELDAPPPLLLCASAIGYYGDRGDELLNEHSKRGAGFLADVCHAWEYEALRAAELGVRVVLLRIGIVLTAEGGALGEMLPLFRRGLGGVVGSGRQWMSWIHIDDVVQLIAFIARTRSVFGAINAVSPNPVSNRDFTRALSTALNTHAWLPVPALALKLTFGDKSRLILQSQRVVPEAALQAGYTFKYPDLLPALDAALGDGQS